ncbi:hypothetical protein niasHT_027685 [Heterodera trifolii]|uniref:Galectin domain-containing protein n=1 Tax=Heterodera trifolii TaxID=157864 RepID=A0ABD2K9X7_9BILA
MRILLKIALILCHFFALNGIQSFAYEQITKPTRLTGHGTKVTTIQIQNFDQCFPRDETKTFGLEFRLPRDGGRCEDGLIICYPSIMATGVLDNHHSMDTVAISNEMFNIDNIANNLIAEECQNEAKKHANSMAKITWHGIGIKLNRQGDSMSTAILNTSFSEKSFIVPEMFHQFNIHLGNKNNFSAYITVDEEVIDVEDEKIAQYKQKSLIGAKMRDFVGFWVLGLDMIPWDEQAMKVFVIRHCNCSLEAWFLRPSDSDPTDLKEASMGTGRFEDRCVTETQKLTMPIHILDVNQVISIRLLTDKMLNNTITLKLWHSIKGKEVMHPCSEYSFLKVRIKLLDLNTTHFKLFLLHNAIEPVDILGATVMQLEVTVTKENVATIELSEFYKNQKKYLPNESKKIENKFIELLNNGKQRTFEFQIELNEAELNVIINTGYVRTKPKRELPVWAANYIRLEGNVSTLGNPEYAYKNEMNGRMEIIIGKIKKTNPNEIFLVKAKNVANTSIKMPDDFTIKLPTLLNYGDVIQISAHREKGAAVKGSTNNFTFIFMHESLDENPKIGDTLLKIEYSFIHKGNKFLKPAICSSHLNKNNKNKVSIVKHDLSEYGGMFIMQIFASRDKFVINLNHEQGGQRPKCLYPINTVDGKIVTIPPWAVDHIRIRGNKHFGEIKFDFFPNKMNVSKRITTLRQISAKNGFGFLKTGDRINVVVQRNANKIPSSLNVSFLNEALEFNEIIGKTIMKAEVLREQLTLSHYINGKWDGTKNCANMKLTETYKFEFIVVNNTAFNVSVNEVKNCAYSTPLPLWAIQYITVGYDKSSFHAPIITCDPSIRCFEPTFNNSKMHMEFPEKKEKN